MFQRFTLCTAFYFFAAILHFNAKAQDSRLTSAIDFALPWGLSKSNTKAVELTSMRNRFSTHYRMKDGSYKMISATHSLFYPAPHGWQVIDNTVEPKNNNGDQQHPFANKTNAFKTAYPRQVLSGTIRTELAEGVLEEQIERVYAVDKDNKAVYQCKANACQAVVCADATIRYENIFPHVAIQYTQQHDGRKFDLIIQDANFLNALPLDATHLVIKEKLFLPKHFTIKPDKDGYNMYSGAKWIANLQTPIAYDKINGSETNQTNGQLTIAMIDNEVYLYTKFPIDWMRSSQRNFPLHLDPTMIFYPDSVMFATGRMNTAATTKISGLMSVLPTVISWASFNISTLPAGANISDGHYWGYHYSGAGAGDKKAKIIGMQSVNPISALPYQINTQMGSGPVYDTNYVWGSNVFGWHSDTLNAMALSDIASQQGQGWTAFLFAYQSGAAISMLQYGYDATIGSKPYLEINYTLTPCIGTPNPGNTISNLINPCYGAIINLSLQNILNLGSGISYQWFKNGGFVAGATNASYAYTASTITDTVWCVVTCLATGLSATSTPIIINASSYLYCYCTSNASAAQDEDIFNVTLNGSSTNPLYANANGCVNVAPGPGSMLNKYSSFLSLPPLVNLINGMAVPFSIEQDECDNAPYFNNTIGIWIDWNHNASFLDPGELVYMSPTGMGPRILSGVFTVPITVLTGNAVMRVVCTEGATPTPCGTYAYGETEDYLVNITYAPCFPSSSIGSTMASASSVCIGNTCNLSLQIPPPSTSAVTYQWFDASGAIAGATNSTYGSVINATNTFYCQATCPSPVVTLSSIPVTVTVATPTSATSALTNCDSYTWNAAVYTNSGIYIQTLVNALGCDSVHTLNLTIHNSTNSSVSITGCDSVQYNGVYYFTSGLYTQIFTNALGCDSIVSINATIHNSNAIVLNFAGCDSVVYGGLTYFSNASITQNFSNMNGCDSIVTTAIQVHQGTDSTITSTDCDYYLAGGTMYTSSGNYTQIFTNVVGCDSVMHYNLTINQSTDSLINAVSCNLFTLNGQTYTTSGTYTQSYTNAAGCDSALTLQVSVDTLNATITINGVTLTTPNLGTYQWIDCSTMMPIPGATSLNFMPTVSGDYAIEVTAGTCVDTSICVPLWMVGVNDVYEERMFVFPNPTQGIFDMFLPEDAEIHISNALGDIVFQQTFKKGKHTINLTAKASGIYFIKSTNGNAIKIVKIAKE